MFRAATTSLVAPTMISRRICMEFSPLLQGNILIGLGYVFYTNMLRSSSHLQTHTLKCLMVLVIDKVLHNSQLLGNILA